MRCPPLLPSLSLPRPAHCALPPPPLPSPTADTYLVCYALGRAAFNEVLGPIEDVWRYEVLRKVRWQGGGSGRVQRSWGCGRRQGWWHTRSRMLRLSMHTRCWPPACPPPPTPTPTNPAPAGACARQPVRAAAVPAGSVHGEPRGGRRGARVQHGGPRRRLLRCRGGHLFNHWWAWVWVCPAHSTCCRASSSSSARLRPACCCARLPPDGEGRELARCGKGQCFGELALLNNEPR